jgi:hypothetical protein
MNLKYLINVILLTPAMLYVAPVAVGAAVVAIAAVSSIIGGIMSSSAKRKAAKLEREQREAAARATLRQADQDIFAYQMQFFDMVQEKYNLDDQYSAAYNQSASEGNQQLGDLQFKYAQSGVTMSASAAQNVNAAKSSVQQQKDLIRLSGSKDRYTLNVNMIKNQYMRHMTRINADITAREQIQFGAQAASLQNYMANLELIGGFLGAGKTALSAYAASE